MIHCWILHIWRGDWICSENLINVEAIRLPKSHFIKRKDDNNKTGQLTVIISQDLLYQVHRYVLNNSDEVQPYKGAYGLYTSINPV